MSYDKVPPESYPPPGLFVTHFDSIRFDSLVFDSIRFLSFGFDSQICFVIRRIRIPISLSTSSRLSIGTATTGISFFAVASRRISSTSPSRRILSTTVFTSLRRWLSRLLLWRRLSSSSSGTASSSSPAKLQSLPSRSSPLPRFGLWLLLFPPWLVRFSTTCRF